MFECLCPSIAGLKQIFLPPLLLLVTKRIAAKKNLNAIQKANMMVENKNNIEFKTII
jgi:hypothetical protein